MSTAGSFDPRWQTVTCSGCKRSYTCTPGEDYYPRPGGRIESATSGRCFGCMLTAAGMSPETTPAPVVDLDGSPADPRDLSHGPGGDTR